MRIAISALGPGLDAQFSPLFGRCKEFVLVDTETSAVETVANTAENQTGGAGIQAAQTVINQGAKAVITGNVGPNAHRVFAAANIPIYQFNGTTVREAIEKFKRGQLESINQPTSPGHAGQGKI